MKQVIEKAFALLKGRFQRLKYLHMSCADLIPYVILASCILHNIYLEDCEDNVDDFIFDGIEQNANNDDRIMRMLLFLTRYLTTKEDWISNNFCDTWILINIIKSKTVNKIWRTRVGVWYEDQKSDRMLGIKIRDRWYLNHGRFRPYKLYFNFVTEIFYDNLKSTSIRTGVSRRREPLSQSPSFRTRQTFFVSRIVSLNIYCFSKDVPGTCLPVQPAEMVSFL